MSSNRIISEFSHLIENGQSLSTEQIANKTLEMMQMLAKNPSMVPTWQLLKESLQELYNRLDDEQDMPLEKHVVNTLKMLEA
jgi:hypothetical protein